MPESSKMSHKNTKISGRINASWCCSVVLTTCWVIIITDGQACKNFVDYNELLTAKLHCVSKIGSHLMFDNNIDKCGWFSKFFHQLMRELILYVHIKASISATICCYTALWKPKIQKCYWFWQHPQQTVDMFLTTLWTFDLTFDSS